MVLSQSHGIWDRGKCHIKQIQVHIFKVCWILSFENLFIFFNSYFSEPSEEILTLFGALFASNVITWMNLPCSQTKEFELERDGLEMDLLMVID